jgi:hypothetical protein
MTDEGIERLAMVIKRATDVMQECSTMYEFRQKWLKEKKVPYQTDAF